MRTKHVIVLAVTLLALDVWDAGCTLWHFSQWVGVYESNPVTGPLLATPPLFVLVKLALVGAGAGLLVWLAVRRSSRWAVWALRGTVAVYGGVAAWHVAILAVPAGTGW